MKYDLYIGDRTYSSWSLRAWLLFDVFDLPYRLHHIAFAEEVSVREQLNLDLAATVPTVVAPDGTILSDSLSIAEELASRHPEAGLWPSDPKARGTARNLTAEMHSGFAPLRSTCPMNLKVAHTGLSVDDDLQADLARIEEIWQAARSQYSDRGQWLVGEYSIADAFYAPVAARIAGYSLPMSDRAMDYVHQHLAHGSFRRWRAMGIARGPYLDRYRKDLPETNWPGPEPMAAEPVAEGPSVNARCPYSDEPVQDFLSLDGTIYGFCNAFCRDKTVADPESWPKFMALLARS